jgi:phosphoenolpyruvate synthase/pyruvate phosphate dikinase
VKKKQTDKFQDYYETVIFPFKMADVFIQEIDILKSALNFKKGADLKKEAEKMQKKYGYFAILNLDEEPIPISYFKKEINKKSKNSESLLKRMVSQKQKYILQNNKKYEKIIKSISDKKLKNLINAVHKIAYYRDYRNEIRRQGFYLIKKLYVEIAERLNKDIKSIIMLTRNEIADALAGKNNLREKKNFLIMNLDRKVYFLEGREFNKIKGYLVEEIKAVSEFKGISASPGRVITKVNLVLDAFTDDKKFINKNVLVTSMTNVDFLPIMSKASAIVTDEGGLLCHAAIVSRELGIPCIVGTKIATKVLKNGMRVEVDADKGIVRII